MVQNKGLQEDMSETAQENLEHLRGVGVSKDITEMEGYEPTMRVGTENNFSRDFAANGAKRSTSHVGSATTDVTADLPVALMDPNPVDPSAPTPPVIAPTNVINVAASRINTNQVALTANPTRIVFASPQRLSVIINNRDLADAVFIGANSAVSANTGFAIDPGASMTMAVSCELWAVSAGAIVAVIEFLE